MPEPHTILPANVDETAALLAAGQYVADRQLSTAVFLALTLHRPLLLEGEAGVGKTELGKVLAQTLNRELIRLQCYEGLDLASAAYEWNYPRQMVAIRLAEAEGRVGTVSKALYTEDYLIERPLLAAIRPRPGGPPVLLIDEVDRADEPFEAFLLELLSDFQLSIPELGTIRADSPPIVVITSNRTREIHDALRRRCLYHWIDYPTLEAESRIVALKASAAAAELRRQMVEFVQILRKEDLFKPPGIAETIDWAHALAMLGVATLSAGLIDDTLGSLLKYQDDIARVRGTAVSRILSGIRAAA